MEPVRAAAATTDLNSTEDHIKQKQTVYSTIIAFAMVGVFIGTFLSFLFMMIQAFSY